MIYVDIDPVASHAYAEREIQSYDLRGEYCPYTYDELIQEYYELDAAHAAQQRIA